MAPHPFKKAKFLRHTVEFLSISRSCDILQAFFLTFTYCLLVHGSTGSPIILFVHRIGFLTGWRWKCPDFWPKRSHQIGRQCTPNLQLCAILPKTVLLHTHRSTRGKVTLIIHLDGTFPRAHPTLSLPLPPFFSLFLPHFVVSRLWHYHASPLQRPTILTTASRTTGPAPFNRDRSSETTDLARPRRLWQGGTEQ